MILFPKNLKLAHENSGLLFVNQILTARLFICLHHKQFSLNFQLPTCSLSYSAGLGPTQEDLPLLTMNSYPNSHPVKPNLPFRSLAMDPLHLGSLRT